MMGRTRQDDELGAGLLRAGLKNSVAGAQFTDSEPCTILLTTTFNAATSCNLAWLDTLCACMRDPLDIFRMSFTTRIYAYIGFHWHNSAAFSQTWQPDELRHIRPCERLIYSGYLGTY